MASSISLFCYCCTLLLFCVLPADRIIAAWCLLFHSICVLFDGKTLLNKVNISYILNAFTLQSFGGLYAVEIISSFCVIY